MRTTPSEPESLQELATQIAGKYGVPATTLFNLIESESDWNPDAYNERSRDRGLAQISEIYHPEVSDEEAFDPEFALNFAAKTLAEGSEYQQYVVCNCYSLVKTKIRGLPKMVSIIPNTPEPIAGMVAVFDYSGTKHIAYITGVDTTGIEIFEANYEPCKVSSRFVSYDDPHLLGYWTPG